MFDAALLDQARDMLDAARAKNIRIVTAESCTGGLITALLTEIPGSSDVMERGFVTYSNEAKEESLGVPATLLGKYGAVSDQVARAMADGALRHARAQLAIAVTGIAHSSRIKHWRTMLFDEVPDKKPAKAICVFIASGEPSPTPPCDVIPTNWWDWGEFENVPR